MKWRRRAVILCLCAIVLSRVNLTYVWRSFFDHGRLQAEMLRFADWWPQFPPFLDAVRAHTQKGDSIIILAPAKSWILGYAYAYLRGSYMLAGRTVLPYLTYPTELHPENIDRVRYVAVYRTDAPALPGATLVWRGKFGELLRR